VIHSDELLVVAKRIFWFGTPEDALEFPSRFLTYAMTYASDEDIEILRKYLSDADFEATLDDHAPGIFNRRCAFECRTGLGAHESRWAGRTSLKCD